MTHKVVIGVKGSHVSVHRHFLSLGVTFAFHQFTEEDCTAVSLCFSRPVTRAQLVAAAAPLHVQSEEATRKLIETIKAKPICDIMRWDAKHKIPLQGPLKAFVTDGEPFALDLYLPPNTAGFANVYTVGQHSIIVTDYKTALALRQVQAFQDRLVPEAKSICQWLDNADDETHYRTFSASWAVNPKWTRPPNPNDTHTAKLSANTYAGAAAKLSQAGAAAKLSQAGNTNITELAIQAAEALLAFAAARPEAPAGTKRKCFG